MQSFMQVCDYFNINSYCTRQLIDAKSVLHYNIIVLPIL